MADKRPSIDISLELSWLVLPLIAIMITLHVLGAPWWARVGTLLAFAVGPALARRVRSRR